MPQSVSGDETDLSLQNLAAWPMMPSGGWQTDRAGVSSSQSHTWFNPLDWRCSVSQVIILTDALVPSCFKGPLRFTLPSLSRPHSVQPQPKMIQRLPSPRYPIFTSSLHRQTTNQTKSTSSSHRRDEERKEDRDTDRLDAGVEENTRKIHLLAAVLLRYFWVSVYRDLFHSASSCLTRGVLAQVVEVSKQLGEWAPK